MGPPIKSNRIKRSCFKKERVGGQKERKNKRGKGKDRFQESLEKKNCLDIMLVCITFKINFQRLDFPLVFENRHDVMVSPSLTALPDGKTTYQALMRSSDSICILNKSDWFYALFVGYNI